MTARLQLSTEECREALRKKYPAPQYALLEEVANGTGWAGKGWADAVAMGLWPSRGLTLSGFEIKISRSDWQRELKKPAKNEAVQAYCDHWWIVAPSRLIEPHELPPTWGLLEVTEKLKTRVKVAAPKLEAKPLDRMIVAAMMRRAAESQEALLRQQFAKGREEGARNGAGELASRLKASEKRQQELYERVREFEKASGVSISHTWDAGDIGAAVRILRNGSHRRDVERLLEGAIRSYDRLAKLASEELCELQKIHGGPDGNDARGD